MYIPGDQPDALDALLDHYHVLCRSRPALPAGISLPLLPGRDVEALTVGCTFEVRDGVLDLLYGDRIAIILQPGDIFSIPDQANWPITLRSEESGVLHVINPWDLQKALQYSDWAWRYTRLIMAQNQVLALGFAASNRHGVRPTAGFRRLRAGDVIIREATRSDEIFTLMRGNARVEVSGHRIGHVDEGEIFGVLSALTDCDYTATVIAETDVTLMSVPSDEFISLVQAQPETFMRLLRTLSRHIGDLNQQLVAALKEVPEKGARPV